MTDKAMDEMMADGLLSTVREAAHKLYGETQTYPCDDVKRMVDDIEHLREANTDLIAANRDNLMWFESANEDREKLRVAMERIYQCSNQQDVIEIARIALEGDND